MLRVLAAMAIAVLSFGGHAIAQDYPNKPIRLIVGFPPGAGTDATARLAAEFLSQRLGQPVVVENKGGAGTAIAADFIAKAKNDGYTLFWGTSDSFSILPAVKKELAFKPIDDFDFIVTTLRYSLTLVVNASRPYKTVDELVAFGKANPGKLRYSSSGVGSAPHLAMSIFAKAAGIEFVHVPFPGSAPALTSAVAGHVDMIPTNSAQPYIESGQVLAIANVGSERHFQLPNVPTLKERGIPAAVDLYIGIVAPHGTPEPIQARWRKEIKAMYDDPKIGERMRSFGYQPVYLESADFKKAMAADLAVYADVAKTFGISLD